MAVRSLGAGSSVRVVQEYLGLDDPRVGVTYGSTDNQAAKVQSAWDMAANAGGGTVLCAGKLRANKAELLWPEQGGGRGAFRFLGIGSGGEFSESPSGIWWDADTATTPAPGDHANTSFGIRVSTNSLVPTIEKMTLQGPGESVAIGDMPCNKYGLFMPTRCIMNDVTLTRWGAGIGIINDHQVFRDIDVRGNGYGIDFMDNSAGGLGDLLFDRIFLTGGYRASIALSDSNAIANARFIQCHFGATPFGVYRYAGQETPRTVALSGVVFDNTSFEYCGNAMFYDEAGGGGWANIVFDSPGEFATGGSAKWPGKPWPMAKMHIDQGEGFHWRSGPIIPQADNADQPVVSAKDFFSFTVDDPRPLFDAISVYSHKSFVRRSGGIGSKYVGGRIGVTESPDGLALGAMEASEDIAKGSLVEMVGTNQVREARNDTSCQAVGVSIIAYTAGDVCVYVTNGARSGLVVRNSSGSTIANGALLTPDGSHQGCVKAAASLNDLIVGRAHDGSIASGATGPIMVSL